MQGILLAAGRSRRFSGNFGGNLGGNLGGSKLLHPLPDGTPMALAAARSLAAALPGSLAVVNGAEPELIALLEQAGLRVSVCPNATLGMGASLAWGVAQTPDADGWLIALADMPWIHPETHVAVAHAITGPGVIAAPLYREQRGHPVAFGRAYRKELLVLDGDVGARRLIAAHAAALLLLPGDDPGVLRDIDLRQEIGEDGMRTSRQEE